MLAADEKLSNRATGHGGKCIIISYKRFTIDKVLGSV
jgi:hypothetical protein